MGMIEYPNGDSAEVKGLTVTVRLGDESIEQIKREVKEEFRVILKENEKLRELVRDMLRWMPCPKNCLVCERYRYPEGCEFEQRWRELGIEVGE